MSTATNRLAGKAKNIALKDVQEAEILIKDAVKSQAYLYPIKGIYYFLTHSQLSKPLRDELGPTISTAVSVAGTMFFFTYLPQVAVLTLFNGPLAVVSTIFLVLSESATITNLISRSFFIEDALVDTFDGTLLIRDQGELVAQGRIIKPRGSAADTMSRLGKILKRPFARFTPTSLIRYFMYLPLNLIPIIGPILFITFQARKSGPQAHARYFQLKGMNKRQREEWVQPRTAEYIGFGIPAILLEMIPFVGIFFTFTNTVGAALWAADIEKRNPRPAPPSAEPDTLTVPSDQPPAYEDLEF